MNKIILSVILGIGLTFAGNPDLHRQPKNEPPRTSVVRPNPPNPPRGPRPAPMPRKNPPRYIMSPMQYSVDVNGVHAYYRPVNSSDYIDVCQFGSCTRFYTKNYTLDENYITIHGIHGDKTYNTDNYEVHIVHIEE